MLSELTSRISDAPEKIDEMVLRNKKEDRPKRSNPVADLTLSSSHEFDRYCGTAESLLILLDCVVGRFFFFVEFFLVSCKNSDLRTLRAGLSLGLEEEEYKVRMVLSCKNKRYWSRLSYFFECLSTWKCSNLVVESLVLKSWVNQVKFNYLCPPIIEAMAKKGNRVQVILECTEHKDSGKPGTSRYVTTKNRKNTPDRMELKKFNPVLRKNTVHKEIK